MSFKESAEFKDNFLISVATTENPFPYSPALAASIAAFNPKRFVCLAIFFIKSNTLFMFVISSSNFLAVSLTFSLVPEISPADLEMFLIRTVTSCIFSETVLIVSCFFSSLIFLLISS